MDQPPKPAAPLGGFKFKLKLGGVVLPQQDAPPPQPAPVASAPPPPPQPELQRPPSFASASSEQPPQAAPAPKKLLFRISSAALQGAAQAPGQAGPILPKIKVRPPAAGDDPMRRDTRACAPNLGYQALLRRDST